MKFRLYGCSAALALQRNSTLHSSEIPTAENRDREQEREKKEEKLYSALCHRQPAHTLNAANPSWTQECEDREILWPTKDNISSAILDGFQLKEVIYKPGCLKTSHFLYAFIII